MQARGPGGPAESTCRRRRPTPRPCSRCSASLERVGAVAGVEEVAAIYPSPLSGSGIATGARTEGSGDQWPETIDLRLGSAGAFHILGIPLRAGRDFRADDVKGHPEVIVVNEALARKLWPGQDPLGKAARPGHRFARVREVVGVVGDVAPGGRCAGPPRGLPPADPDPLPAFDLLLRSRSSPARSRRRFGRRCGAWTRTSRSPRPRACLRDWSRTLEARKLAAASLPGVRRGGAAPLGHRHRWPPGQRGDPADARDGHPPGAGRAGGRPPQPGGGRRAPAGRCRPLGRRRPVGRRGTGDPRLPLRRRPRSIP